MTKEELKQEVEDWWNNTFKVFYLTHNQLDKMCSDLLEPREKQIQIDAEQIRALQKQNGELTDKVKELEAQIEKMKNCGNCKNYSPTYGLCCYSLGDEDYDCRLRKWEIKEK